MPKKTKKQKLRSDTRREHETLQFQYTPTASSAHTAPPPRSELLPDQLYVRRDITKTIILGSIFLAFEIALYLYTQRLGW